MSVQMTNLILQYTLIETQILRVNIFKLYIKDFIKKHFIHASNILNFINILSFVRDFFLQIKKKLILQIEFKRFFF